MQPVGLIPKCLYTENDLKNSVFNLCDLPNRFSKKETENIISTARSIGCLIEEKWLREVSTDIWSTTVIFHQNQEKKTLEGYAKEYCEGPPDHSVIKKVEILFSKEPCLGQGTAFLIEKDKMLSAGHCFFKNLDSPDFKIELPKYVVFEVL